MSQTVLEPSIKAAQARLDRYVGEIIQWQLGMRNCLPNSDSIDSLATTRKTTFMPTKHLLRLQIEGEWTAQDFGQSMLDLRALYNLLLLLEKNSYGMRRFRHEELFSPHWYLLIPFIAPIPIDPSRFIEATDRFYPDDKLMVTRVEYASPGFTDLTGAGQVIGHIKDFLVRVLEMYTTRHQRKLENQERREKIIQQRIENAERLVRLAKECGYSDAELRPLIYWVDDRQETFARLAQSGQLKSVEMLPIPQKEEPPTKK